MTTTFPTGLSGLAGRTARVPGAGRALGRAIAQHLGAAGARVVINDLDKAACERTISQLREEGIQATASVFNVTDAPAVQAEVDRLEASGWAIDILVSNAGNQNRKSLTEMTIEEWKQIQAVHVDGAFNCCHAVLPFMVERRRGAVVLMSSVSAMATMPNIGAYATAKGALASVARAIPVEYGGHGITCNALAPGFVRTAFTSALQERAEFQTFLKQAVPAGRWAEPEDIAPLVVALAAKAGSFINGQVVALDGGLLARM